MIDCSRGVVRKLLRLVAVINCSYRRASGLLHQKSRLSVQVLGVLTG